jgi:stearoyl-CoA desaturase (delta-9 desaturase)
MRRLPDEYEMFNRALADLRSDEHQVLAVSLWLIGSWPALVWGFFVSTTLLWHGTFTINSLSHKFGNRRYETSDDSKNNWLLALVTMGEGWHNNHHYYMSSTRQGIRWWEVDVTYYLLCMLSWVGIARDLRPFQPSHPTE